MLAGYGMTAEHRAKTAATLNGLWDTGELSVSRGTTGRLQLYDRRLSLHWLIQPEAAAETMADPLLSSIGFWPRFLLAWPEPSPPREPRPWRAEQSAAIGEFWRTCTRLLHAPLGEDCSRLTLIEPVYFAAARGTVEHADHAAGFAPFLAAMQLGQTEAAAAHFNALWGAQPWGNIPPRVQRYLSERIHLVAASGPEIEDDPAGITSAPLDTPVTSLDPHRRGRGDYPCSRVRNWLTLLSVIDQSVTRRAVSISSASPW